MKESLTHISVNKEEVKKMRQLLDDYHAKNDL
jgi:hypothetical protein